LMTWLQLYSVEARDLSAPPNTIEFAKYRADRLDRLTKRHVRAIELLAKLRSNKSESVKIENVTINQTVARKPQRRRKTPAGTANRVSAILDNLELNQN
jgi:hypothetical protein